MKLLVVSHPCATPTNQRLYAEVQNRTGWDMTLIVPADWKTEFGRRAEASRLPGFRARLIALPVFNNGNIILHAYRARLARLLKQIEPDAIYVHQEPYALSAAQACVANRRTVRAPMGFYSAQNLVKRYPPPFRWTQRWVFGHSAFAFPVSRTVAQTLRHNGFRGDAAVLPLGIDPQVYFPRPEAKEGGGIAEGLRKSPDETLIGYVGRLVPEKGLATLVAALAQLGDAPWRLVVVGAGPFRAEMDARAAALGIAGRITHVGFVPHEQTPAYLSACDIIAIPSETQPNWKEQFGRVVIEALACGTPVVGSDSGEIPALLRATSGGLIFPERDSHALARTLQTLIRDPALRRRLAAAGAVAVTRQYSQSAVAATFAATVERAVARHRGTIPKSELIAAPAGA